MSQGVQDLFQAALALSVEEQLELVAALVSAVDERGLSAPEEIWLEAIRRRSTAVEFKASSSPEKLRPIGLAAGLFRVPDDFDAPLPDDLLQAFEG